jgi:hypothetical protein
MNAQKNQKGLKIFKPLYIPDTVEEKIKKMLEKNKKEEEKKKKKK